MRWLLPVLFLSAGTAAAQVEPIPSGEDSRIGVMFYTAGQMAHLRTAPDTYLALLMPRGEHIQQVILGDTSAWRSAVSEPRDELTLVAVYPISNTSLSVRTDRNSYEFTLTAATGIRAPYLVRIENGGSTIAGNFSSGNWTPPVVVPPGSYRVSGNRELRPATIRDDGAKTYIEWDPAQAMPAVFSLSRLGNEEMVNGYMRGSAFIIDRIYNTLVFRIDKARATARRYLPKVRK